MLLWIIVEDHDTLFILSESVHFVGIGVLSYKLLRKKNCGGVRRPDELRPAGQSARGGGGWGGGGGAVPRGGSDAVPSLPRAGLSRRTQELTACFLAVRLFCSFMMEYDIHTLLDFFTLAATGACACLIARAARL